MQFFSVFSRTSTEMLVALFIIIAVFGLLVDVWLAIKLPHKSKTWRKLAARLAKKGLPSFDSSALILSIIALASIAAEFISKIEMPVQNPKYVVVTMTLQLFFLHLLPLFFIYIILRVRKTSLKTAFGFDRNCLKEQALKSFALYAGAIPPLIILSWFWDLILDSFGIQADRQKIIDIFLEQSFWPASYIGIIAIFVAPLVEEIIFRGVALPLLLRSANPILAISAVSVVFACMHFHLPSFAPLFFIAIWTSFSYLLTGSIVTPILIHVFFNIGSLLAAKIYA